MTSDIKRASNEILTLRNFCGALHRSIWKMGYRLVIELKRCDQRSRQRSALSKLDQRLLDDVGISAKQAETESQKPPWEE